MTTKSPTKKATSTPSGIYAKLAAIRGEVGYMTKDGKNTSQGYSYLSETQVAVTFKELLDKYKVHFEYSSEITNVTPTPSGKQMLTDVQVNYSFVDIETGEKSTGRAAGQGSDPTDKGVYKAITGAVKYIFMKTFLIPTGDDPENDKEVKKSSGAPYIPATDPLADYDED